MNGIYYYMFFVFLEKERGTFIDVFHGNVMNLLDIFEITRKGNGRMRDLMI